MCVGVVCCHVCWGGGLVMLCVWRRVLCVFGDCGGICDVVCVWVVRGL